MIVYTQMENSKEGEVIFMSERDFFLMYLPQIAELIVDCQQMTYEDYEQRKKETRESTLDETMGFMEKIFVITDQYSGHQISA